MPHCFLLNRDGPRPLSSEPCPEGDAVHEVPEDDVLGEYLDKE